MQLSDSDLKKLKENYEDLRGKTLDKNKLEQVSKMLSSLNLENLEQMVDMDIAILSEIAKEKIKEKQEELPKKEEDNTEKLKAEIEKKDDEIQKLKVKAETEKAKQAKKETEKMVNPETGEPLLQVGVAYKHLKDKMKNEDVKKEDIDKSDEKKIKPIIKQLKKSVKSHAKQAKTLEKELQENDYGLMGRMSDAQIQNIKKVWAKKTPKDVTQGVKDMIKKMDIPTQLAIKVAKINVLSDLIETKEQSSKSIQSVNKKSMYERIKNIMQKKKEEKQIDEKNTKIKDIFNANKEGESAEEIAKRLKLPVSNVKRIIGESHYKPNSHVMVKGKRGQIVRVNTPEVGAYYTVKMDDGQNIQVKSKDISLIEAKSEKEIDAFHKELDKVVHKHFGHSSDEKKNMKEIFTSNQIADLQKAYAPMKGKTISPEKASMLSKKLDFYDLSSLRQLVKANIPFVSTIARNKVYRKTGKFEGAKKLVVTI